MNNKQTATTLLLSDASGETIRCNTIHQGICISDSNYNIDGYTKLIRSFIENTEVRELDAPILLIDRIINPSPEESYRIVSGFLERTKANRITGATEDFLVTLNNGNVIVVKKEVRIYDPE